jgi:hypothetical protein
LALSRYAAPRRIFYFLCFSTKPSIIGGGSIKIMHPNKPKIKPQAQPGVLSPFLIVISLVKVEANKTKEK